MSSLLNKNKSILKDAMGEAEHTLTPAVACAIAVVSQEGMDVVRSVGLVISVDVKVAGPGPRSESRDGFLDFKIFLKMRFISLMMMVVDEPIYPKQAIIMVKIEH